MQLNYKRCRNEARKLKLINFRMLRKLYSRPGTGTVSEENPVHQEKNVVEINMRIDCHISCLEWRISDG